MTTTADIATKPETFGILYCYGFNLGLISREAAIECNRRAVERGQLPVYDMDYKLNLLHNNQILVEMFEDREWNVDGTRLNGEGTYLHLRRYDVKYCDYLQMKEYDGAITTPFIDFGAYLTDNSTRILLDTAIDNDTKIAQLHDLYFTAQRS